MGEAVARQGSRKGDFLTGKYLLGDCLGIGGMGEVYSATNVSLGRNVAIKILNADFAKNEDDVLRFLREARAAAAVRHPNVVDVLDVARDEDGTPFIVQELLSGQDLEQHLQAVGGRMTVGETLEVMIPVADAVAAAHARSFVHRDLKPANIFLARETDRLVPKVLDFGACLYKTVGGLSSKEMRMLIGTPHYMAPEQIISKSDVDVRADVWALGVILYELLVGETPFEAETANKVLELVKQGKVPPLRDQCRRAPEELEALVMKCTQRERTKRPESASAVREELVKIRDARKSVSVKVKLPAPELKAKEPEKEKEKEEDDAPPSSRVPSLALATPKGPTRRRGSALLTLSEPEDTSESDDGPLSGPSSTQRPIEASRTSPTEDRHDSSIGRGPFEMDDSSNASFELDFEKSDRRERPSSIPPVLDPRAASAKKTPQKLERPVATGSVRPPKTTSNPGMSAVQAPASRRSDPPADATPRPQRDPLRTSQAGHTTSPLTPPLAPPRPPADSVTDEDRLPAIDGKAKQKLALLVFVPALVGYGALRFAPDVTAPLGAALRGETTIASGVFAVIALVTAAVIGSRVPASRSRAVLVAAIAAVALGILMIIVTFSASEAIEVGVPSGPALAIPFVAPIVPLALGLAWLRKARVAIADKYDQRDAIIAALVASLLLLVALELGPAGAVRARGPAKPPAPSAPVVP